MQLENITLAEYSIMQDSDVYDFLQDLEPVNLFATKTMNVTAMPWLSVRHCIKLLSKSKDWNVVFKLFHQCYDVDEKEFLQATVYEFYQANNYMMEQFKKLIEREVQVMFTPSVDDEIWQQAGMDKLNQFNDMLPLIQLGKAFGMYPYDIGRKPYREVFNMLVPIKIQGEVESEFHKLKSKH